MDETFNYIFDPFREAKKQHEGELRHLNQLLEHVLVPLISVYSDHQIALCHKADRRQFGSIIVTKVIDLRLFGMTFMIDIQAITPGKND